jgi:hypothetical protein
MIFLSLLKLMKTVITLFIIAFASSPLPSQNDTINIYMMALKSHIANYSKSAGRDGSQFKPTDTVFIINEVVANFPNMLNGHPLIEINDNVQDILTNKSSFIAFKLFPMQVDQGSIDIQVGDFVVKKGDADVKFLYAGGRAYSFLYNKKEKKYKLIVTKNISF